MEYCTACLSKTMSNFSVFLLLVILLHILAVGDGTLSKSSKRKGKKNGSKTASKIARLFVVLRG